MILYDYFLEKVVNIKEFNYSVDSKGCFWNSTKYRGHTINLDVFLSIKYDKTPITHTFFYDWYNDIITKETPKLYKKNIGIIKDNKEYEFFGSFVTEFNDDYHNNICTININSDYTRITNISPKLLQIIRDQKLDQILL